MTTDRVKARRIGMRDKLEECAHGEVALESFEELFTVVDGGVGRVESFVQMAGLPFGIAGREREMRL